jgi:hypothetical protein
MFVGRGVDTALVPEAAGSGLASGLISQYFTPTDNSFGSDSTSGGVNFKPMK